MRKTKDFMAGADDSNRRLDRVLRILLGGASLAAIYEGLRKKRILVNGKRAEPSYRLVQGDRISIDEIVFSGDTPDSALQDRSRPSTHPFAQREDLEALTILGTEDLLFLNKPRGLLTHGEDSLDLMVKEATAGRGRASLSFRPAPLNRLDRNTSGLVAFSLSTRGAQGFTAFQREGRLEKSYLALLAGRLPGRQDWEDRLERDEESMKSSLGKRGELALTSVRPIIATAESSLALVRIETGRTHQIRLQCSAHGFPLIGDTKYGGSERPEGYFLHAWLLRFKEELFADIPKLIKASIPEVWIGRLGEAWGQMELGEKLREAEDSDWTR